MFFLSGLGCLSWGSSGWSSASTVLITVSLIVTEFWYRAFLTLSFHLCLEFDVLYFTYLFDDSYFSSWFLIFYQKTENIFHCISWPFLTLIKGTLIYFNFSFIFNTLFSSCFTLSESKHRNNSLLLPFKV